MSKNSLSTNQELHKGDSLLSNDGNYKAIFQDDGNFVIYTWKPIWASNTNGKPGTRLVMQEDGNLVIYNCDGVPLWATNCDQCSKTFNNRVSMNNDGSLVIHRGSMVLWKSK